MKTFFKGLFSIMAFLSALLMALMFLCAWKPELTEEIAAFLYPEQYMTDVSQENDTQDELEAQQSTGSPENPGRYEEAVRERTVPEEDAPETEEIAADMPDTASGYIPPAKEEISVPKQVAGRNGYQEMQGNDSQVEDEEAKKLEDQLDTGETGDGLTFDPLFYPYYAMLDDRGQHVYRQIYANAKALNDAFAPVEPINANELRNIISAVYNDHPELFWLDTAYGCKHRGNGQCVEIDLQFNRTAKNLEGENAAFEKAAKEITDQAQNMGNDYDKERYVHDALVDKIDYVKSAEMNQSAYSALVNGRTVCAGYARAFQYLMQQLGIPCYYCTGYSGESHAWNIIKLEDDYYNVDVTWDDTDDGTYDYFNKTDEDYSDTHVRQELSVNLPPCNGQKYRTANVTAQDAGRRSIGDVGVSEEDILHSLSAYYDDCYNQILREGRGSYSFSNVIEGESLFQEWEQAYDAEAYKQEYMVEAMRTIGAKSCRLNLTIEKLQQERYLITHQLELE